MTSTVPVFDFSMQAGDSATFAMAVKDSAGAAKPITSAAIRFTLWKNGLPQIKFEKTLADDVTITDGPNGLFEVAVAFGEITVAGAYTHQSEVFLSPDSQTVIRGTVLVRPSHTPAT